MGVHVLAVYRPKPGMESRLEAEVAAHVPLLRRLRLATDRPSLALRASDGTILEHFEWVDRESIDAAHDSEEVHQMWSRFASCCSYANLGELPNSGVLFPEFEHLGSF